jgi:hypothetical protein
MIANTAKCIAITSQNVLEVSSLSACYSFKRFSMFFLIFSGVTKGAKRLTGFPLRSIMN